MIHQIMNPTQQHRQRTHYEVLHLRTERTTEFRDITPEVQEVVDHAGIRTGFVKIQSMHTTAASCSTSMSRCCSTI